MSCPGRCHGCAYKSGAAANLEGQNYLRGVFAALGGYPFVCHESLGWGPEREGYPEGSKQALAILTSNRFQLIKAGADPELIEKQVGKVREGMRMCGGWKAAVRRLKDLGWFANRDITLVRRHYAKHAAACLERLTRDQEEFMPDDRRDRRLDIEDIEESIRWFFNEAKDQGIKIGWLFTNEGETQVTQGAGTVWESLTPYDKSQRVARLAILICASRYPHMTGEEHENLAMEQAKEEFVKGYVDRVGRGMLTQVAR